MEQEWSSWLASEAGVSWGSAVAARGRASRVRLARRALAAVGLGFERSIALLQGLSPILVVPPRLDSKEMVRIEPEHPLLRSMQVGTGPGEAPTGELSSDRRRGARADPDLPRPCLGEQPSQVGC